MKAQPLQLPLQLHKSCPILCVCARVDYLAISIPAKTVVYESSDNLIQISVDTQIIERAWDIYGQGITMWPALSAY